MIQLIAVRDATKNKRIIYCVRACSEEKAIKLIKKERSKYPGLQNNDFSAELLKPNIRFLREATGLTQKEFGNRYSIPPRTIQNWEEGRRGTPEYIQRMLTQCVINDIKEEETDPPSEVLFAFWEKQKTKTFPHAFSDDAGG